MIIKTTEQEARATGAERKIPTVGDVVIYRQPAEDAPRNGSHVHRAIITSVWEHLDDPSRPHLNLLVFFDESEPTERLGVTHRNHVVNATDRFWEWPQ